MSVVVPTYNRLPRLARVLGALADQTYSRELYEVVVVSDGSTDGTDDYLRSIAKAGLVVASQSNAGPAAARNHGLALASGSLALFVDDDVVATPQLLERHVESHRRGGDGLVVIGPMLTPPDVELSAWIRWEQAMLYRQYDAMLQGCYAPTPRQFYTGNASVARAAVLAAGGFDTRFRRAEDIELAYRLAAAGLRFEFNPDAVGHHHADRSFDSWCRNAADYGAIDVVLARDQGRTDVSRIVAEGFQRRPGAVRQLTTTCVAHPTAEACMRMLYHAMFHVGSTVRSDRLSRLALSGLYNLAYYRGVADEVGGPDPFRQLVDSRGAQR